ncbi:MAG: voltage-gated potassium channel, partial [Paraglaciecola sp.]
KLLQKHCPNVECTPSVAVEMLAKSAFDPGSSLLHHDLLDVNHGQAQYSDTLPLSFSTVKVSTLFTQLKQQYKATLIGISRAGEKMQIHVNPDLSDTLSPGDKIFYIAERRIKNIQWHKFAEDKHV